MSRYDRLSFLGVGLGTAIIVVALGVDAWRADGPGLLPWLARSISLGILLLAAGALALPGISLRRVFDEGGRTLCLAQGAGEITLWVIVFLGTRKRLHALSHPYHSIAWWILLTALASLGLAFWHRRMLLDSCGR